MEEKKVEKIKEVKKVKFDKETSNVIEAEKLVKEGYFFVGKKDGKYQLVKGS